MKIWLDCRQVSRLISQSHDDKLALAGRARLRLHFALCARCRNVDQQMAFLRQAMRRLCDEEPPQK